MSREIDRRKAEYVAWVAERFARMEPELAPTDGRLWALNHARLVMAEGTASDQEIRPTTDAAEASRFFEAAKLTGDPDIYFIRFLNTLLDFQHSPLLSDAAKAHLIGILTAWPRTDLSTMSRWPPIHTENHDLMHLTIVLFAKAFDREDLSEQVRAVDKHLTLRFERGWVEWNSPCYQYHYSNPLIVLAQHAPVEGLRAKAEDLLNVMLAERLVMGVDGYLGGPALRCRTADGHDSLTARKIAYLEDNRYDGFLPTVWLAPGLGEARFDYETARVEGLEPAGEH
ncbi:MAG TPA: hypothetical protein QGH10_16485 [Armatimonadota bacterium]|nr:hypothetical protein [Armatimonadota bacterium]